MNHKQKKYNCIEQISFFLGVLILITLVGNLIYQMATSKNTPPKLRIVSKYQPDIPGNVYEIEIENIGDNTAEAINIHLALFQDGNSVETATLKLKYIPAKSKEIGWVSFYKEKQSLDSLKVTSLSFIKP